MIKKAILTGLAAITFSGSVSAQKFTSNEVLDSVTEYLSSQPINIPFHLNEDSDFKYESSSLKIKDTKFRLTRLCADKKTPVFINGLKLDTSQYGLGCDIKINQQMPIAPMYGFEFSTSF